MKKTVAMIALLGLYASCSGEAPEPIDNPEIVWGQVEQRLARASGRFGLDLFSRLAGENQDNLFFSPLSISMALGMTYLGARGETAEAFERTLRFENLTTEEIRRGYRNLLDALPWLDEQVQIQLANAVWHDRNLLVLPSFVEDLSWTFDAPVEGLDFSGQAAVDTINRWVRENTNGRIDRIIDRLNPLEVMVLANAIYFDATWTMEFNPQDTWEQVFETPDGEKKVPLMYLHGMLDYLAHDNFQAVRLPYGESRRLAMTILLPRPGQTVEQLILGLTAGEWEHWQQQFKERSGHLWLPRCEVRYQNSGLLGVLESMGLAPPGTPDFSGISRDGLYLSRVVHKALLKIDETGTEAAAITAVIMDAGCSNPECESEEFYLKADRPFALVIHDRPTNTLLFMGRISDP